MIVKQYIGVDMAKNTFDACFADDKPVKTYPNTERGIASLFRTISSNNTSAINTSKPTKTPNTSIRIGVESTSHYHMLLCMRAKEMNYTPILINPLITNKYSQRNIRKTKTDKIDARIILYCTMQGEGYEWKETAQTLTLKHLIRERDYLAKLEWIMRARQMSIKDKGIAIREQLPTTTMDILGCIEQKMKEVEKQLRQYRKDEQKLLQTIPGVGPLTASACISEIQDIKRFSTPTQLIAYIGIDPKVHQSGSSIDKYRKISKRGNKILRTRLYNACSVAVLHDNQFKEYFQKKKDQGKPYRVALVATMNKMARVIHSVWTNNTPYHEPINQT
ncbi:IS110 family transposase [Patescibacteria group bacterium]|nr:IS110 family transposase [Patescibacteria group bacterium]